MTEPEKLNALIAISNAIYKSYRSGQLTLEQYLLGQDKLKQPSKYWFEFWR